MYKSPRAFVYTNCVTCLVANHLAIQYSSSAIFVNKILSTWNYTLHGSGWVADKWSRCMQCSFSMKCCSCHPMQWLLLAIIEQQQRRRQQQKQPNRHSTTIWCLNLFTFSHLWLHLLNWKLFLLRSSHFVHFTVPTWTGRTLTIWHDLAFSVRYISISSCSSSMDFDWLQNGVSRALVQHVNACVLQTHIMMVIDTILSYFEFLYWNSIFVSYIYNDHIYSMRRMHFSRCTHTPHTSWFSQNTQSKCIGMDMKRNDCDLEQFTFWANWAHNHSWSTYDIRCWSDNNSIRPLCHCSVRGVCTKWTLKPVNQWWMRVRIIDHIEKLEVLCWPEHLYEEN